MKKKAGLVLALIHGLVLLGGSVSLGGCMTLDYEHDVAVINTYGRHISDLHQLTEKYFFNYDADDPFAE